MSGIHIIYGRRDFTSCSGIYETEMCIDVVTDNEIKTYVEKSIPQDSHDYGKRDIARRLAEKVALEGIIKEGDKIIALENPEITIGTNFIRIPLRGGRCSSEDLLSAFYQRFNEERTALAVHYLTS